MNIVLIGLRGSGKTKIGKHLSSLTGLKLIDIDREVESAEGVSIYEIFRKHDWKYFRKKEKEVTKKIAKLDNVIISTGGGTIVDPENQKALKKNGKIIYLKRSPEECYKWIKDKQNRPSLTGKKDRLEDLKRTYADRKSIYEKTSDITIERTENIEEDAEKIIKLLSLA